MPKVIVVPYTLSTDLQEGKYCHGIVFTSDQCSKRILCKISTDHEKGVFYASVVPGLVAWSTPVLPGGFRVSLTEDCAGCFTFRASP